MNSIEYLPIKDICSAKNSWPMRKYFAHKRLRFHGVEDGFGSPQAVTSRTTPMRPAETRTSQCRN